MERHRSLAHRFAAAIAIICGATLMCAVGATAGTAASRSTGAGGSARLSGGTAYWAEPPYVAPNWILPMESLSYADVANTNAFQYLMFRPLYWFGNGSLPTFDEHLSLATAPSFNSTATSVTIHLKGWKWSDGGIVDAQSLIFWMNMIRAERTNWWGYVSGYFPDNVTSVSAVSATSEVVTMTLSHAVNQQWFLYNELSQITPMPAAWDITRRGAPSGSGGCSALSYTAAVARACVRVWTFLSDDGGRSANPHEAADRATYATNPLWQIVDGPWRLSAFSPNTGMVTMVPNHSYSGSPKPTLAKFVEVPFFSDSSEYQALESKSIDVGYLPLEDAPPAPAGGERGPNPAALSSSYEIELSPSWESNYFVENFNSNGDHGQAGYIFRQLYVRQAIQRLTDQATMLKAAFKNYGNATYGPVPLAPRSRFLSSDETTNQYPFDLKTAKTLLAGHGWSVIPGGVDTCARPGTSRTECGAGIRKGARMSFTEVYAGGSVTLSSQVGIEQRDLSRAGIHVGTLATTFDQTLRDATPCARSSSSCSWELANWGGGWIYTPDYLPTGENLFLTGAGSNSGSYSNPTNDRLILATTDSNSSGVFKTWENFVAKHLPVIWQPVSNTPTEVSKSLRGVVDSPFMTLTPEDWYFAK